MIAPNVPQVREFLSQGLAAALDGFKFVKSRGVVERRREGRIVDKIVVDCLETTASTIRVSLYWGVSLVAASRVLKSLKLPEGRYHVMSSSLSAGGTWDVRRGETDLTAVLSDLVVLAEESAIPFFEANSSPEEVWLTWRKAPGSRTSWRLACIYSRLSSGNADPNEVIAAPRERQLAEEFLAALE